MHNEIWNPFDFKWSNIEQTSVEQRLSPEVARQSWTVIWWETGVTSWMLIQLAQAAKTTHKVKDKDTER